MNNFELVIDISIRNYPGGGTLNLRETAMIGDVNFAEMAELLEGFHKVTNTIKEAQERRYNSE